MKDSYVYTYTYPEEMGGAIFYVGKGKGDRMNDHLRNARKGNDSPVCKAIREIWAKGYQVSPRIAHSHLSNEDALILERRTIKEIGIKNLTNRRENSGGGAFSWQTSFERDLERRQLFEHMYSLLRARGCDTSGLTSVLRAYGVMIPQSMNVEVEIEHNESEKQSDGN